jgi:hypothetical protein
VRFVTWCYTPVPALTIVIFTAGGADPGRMGPWTLTSSTQSASQMSRLRLGRSRYTQRRAPFALRFSTKLRI